MTLLVHDPAYGNWVLGQHHPTQGRRFIHGADLIAAQPGVRVERPQPASRTDLLRVHTADYVASVLQDYSCDEWVGARPDLADLATLFVGGTLTALHALLNGEERVAVNLPGGKHHAQADHSSGFCVFADLAIAATVATEAGHRVAILDIDAHHGDGTEALCRDMAQVMTFSVHQQGIFPGTGLADDASAQVYNEPLAAVLATCILRGRSHALWRWHSPSTQPWCVLQPVRMVMCQIRCPVCVTPRLALSTLGANSLVHSPACPSSSPVLGDTATTMPRQHRGRRSSKV